VTALLEVPESPARPAPPERGGVPGWVWLVPPLAVLALLVVWPLVVLAVRTVSEPDRGWTGTDRWSAVLGGSRVWEAAWTSVEIALLSTVGCVLVGTFLAIVVVLLPMPGTGLLARWIEAVVSFPSFLVPLTFGVLFGGAGVVPAVVGRVTGEVPQWTFMAETTGVVLSEIVFFTPFVAGPVIAALHRFPRGQIDAAASLGSGVGRILRRVVLPEIAPAIAAAGSLVFLLTLNEIGIVLFTGAKSVQTLPMLVYTEAVVSGDLATASVVACVEVLLSVTVYLAYRRAFRGVR